MNDLSSAGNQRNNAHLTTINGNPAIQSRITLEMKNRSRRETGFLRLRELGRVGFAGWIGVKLVFGEFSLLRGEDAEQPLFPEFGSRIRYALL